MAGMKKGLGRGLDSLITAGSDLLNSEAKEVIEKAVTTVDIYSVEPDRDQPRKEFDDEKLEELAASIKKYGVISPLLVQKKNDAEGKSYYQIIAGERRWRAAKKAGLKEVPVIIKEYRNEDAFVVSLIENVQREDLNAVEVAEAYERLRNEYGMTHEQLADSVGKSRTAITNSLRLLNLADETRALVASGELSVGHAKVLLGLDDAAKQNALAKKVVEEGLSVRALEALLETKEPAQPKEKKEKKADPVLDSFVRQLSDTLNTKVSIVPGARKGKIEIEYYSQDDLVRLSDILLGNN